MCVSSGKKKKLQSKGLKKVVLLEKVGFLFILVYSAGLSFISGTRLKGFGTFDLSTKSGGEHLKEGFAIQCNRNQQGNDCLYSVLPPTQVNTVNYRLQGNSFELQLSQFSGNINLVYCICQA